MDNLKTEELTRKGQDVLDAFFYETSRRSKRRQRRMERWQKRRIAAAIRRQREINEQEEEEWVDNRTVRQILFPHPYDIMDSPPLEEKKPWRFYWGKLPHAWKEYKAGWRGFWSPGILVIPPEERAEAERKKKLARGDDSDDSDEDDDDDEKKSKPLTPSAIQRKIRRNMRRNTRVAKTTALKLRKEVREITGIKSADDARRMAAELMTLLSECLNEFVSGYRQGRDSQVRQMFEEDLQRQKEEQAKALKKETPSRKKRRTKRRVMGRL